MNKENNNKDKETNNLDFKSLYNKQKYVDNIYYFSILFIIIILKTLVFCYNIIVKIVTMLFNKYKYNKDNKKNKGKKNGK